MADLNLGTFSPEDLIIVVSVGEVSHVVSGYTDGTFVTVERTMESSTLYQGADKSGGRILRSNNSGQITISLHQFSASNDFFQELYNNDVRARDNTWFFNISILDGTGRSSFHARQCFINNLPSVGYGNEVETRDWVLQAVELNQYIGGNAKLPPEVISTLEGLGATVSDRWK